MVLLGLGVLYVTWGSAYVGLRVAVRTVPPLAGASIRFLGAAAVLTLVVYLMRGRHALRTPPAQMLSCAVVGTLLIGGANGLLSVASKDLSAGMAAAIFATAPNWMVAIKLVAGTRVSVTSALGLVVGLLGVCLLVLPRGGLGTLSLAGLLLALLAATSWALGSVGSQHLPLPRDPLVAAVYQLAAGGLILGAAATARHETLTFGPATLNSWTAIAYLTVICTVGSYPIYVWLLGRASVNLVSTLVYVNPLVALGLGAVLLHEAIDLQDLLAIAVVLGSVAAVVRIEASREPITFSTPLPLVDVDLVGDRETKPTPPPGASTGAPIAANCLESQRSGTP